MRVLLCTLIVLICGISADCPVASDEKIPTKCNTCFDFIEKQAINSSTVVDKRVLWGFMKTVGSYVAEYVKNRTSQGNKQVPQMCDVGKAAKAFAVENFQALLSCAKTYNSATVAKLMADGTAAILTVTTNGFNLDEIASSLICAVLECLQKPKFVPKYKKWMEDPDESTIRNNICAVCAEYTANRSLLQTCFNSAKARTRVAVLTKVFDVYVPKYACAYQTYRDKSLVACMTKPQTCNCTITVSDAIDDTIGG